MASKYEEKTPGIFIESQFKRDFNVDFSVVLYDVFYRVSDRVELYKAGFPNARRVDTGFMIHYEILDSRKINIIRDAASSLTEDILNKLIPVSKVFFYESQEGFLVVYKGMLPEEKEFLQFLMKLEEL